MEKIKQIIQIVIYILIGLAILAIAAVVAVYVWPTSDKRLQRPDTRPSFETYEIAVNAINAKIEQDKSDAGIKSECATSARLHEAKPAKAVLLLHGYTACPNQFGEFADALFNAGYNVYIPRAPHHGHADNGRVVPTSQELVRYANESASIVTALGEKSGAIGVSGGAVLATWAAHYRPDAIKQLLVLSPFYEPSADQAPKLALKPLITLYGRTSFIPDINEGQYGTYRGLAQYLSIVRNYSETPSHLPTNLILSPNDKLIDVGAARTQTGRLDPTRTLFYTPVNWGFQHDIVSKAELKNFANDAYQDYIKAYEGKKPDSLVER